MRRFICPVLLSLLAANTVFFQIPKNSTRSTSAEIKERILRIENGLLLPVSVKGQPSEDMKLADRLKFYKTPAVSIAFINNGRVEWARAYGFRAAGSDERVTTDTMFQAGSISKPVTAAIALRLVEIGKLNLDEDVNKKLVSWKVPENEFTTREKVTVRRILSHSAGLTNHAVGNYTADSEIPTLSQILRGIKPANSQAVRVDVVPGTLWRYSGGGYSVLQQLIVDVGGKPFPQTAQDTVFSPLHMGRSTFDQLRSQGFRAGAAVGHGRAGEKIVGDWITFPEMAAAGLWSTPSDLARYAIEIQRSFTGKSNKILKQQTVSQMLTRQIGNWGLGFAVDGAGDSARFSHGGDTEGFKCFLVMYEKSGQGVVIMTNSDRGDRLTDEILRSVAREYGWPDYKPKEKEIVKIDQKFFAEYAGRYQFEFSSAVTLNVSEKDGKLITDIEQPTGRTSAELYPESEVKFFRKDVDIEVTFSKNAAGQVTHLIFRQDGQEFRVNRIK